MEGKRDIWQKFRGIKQKEDYYIEFMRLDHKLSSEPPSNWLFQIYLRVGCYGIKKGFINRLDVYQRIVYFLYHYSYDPKACYEDILNFYYLMVDTICVGRLVDDRVESLQGIVTKILGIPVVGQQLLSLTLVTIKEMMEKVQAHPWEPSECPWEEVQALYYLFSSMDPYVRGKLKELLLPSPAQAPHPFPIIPYYCLAHQPLHPPTHVE